PRCHLRRLPPQRQTPYFDRQRHFPRYQPFQDRLLWQHCSPHRHYYPRWWQVCCLNPPDGPPYLCPCCHLPGLGHDPPV
ncbi:hypothetical protein BGZ89_007588, partial [Linnemannia elongata]